MYDKCSIMKTQRERAPCDYLEIADKMLITAIMKSYFEDIEHHINYAVNKSPQNYDWHLHCCNILIDKMLELDFFQKNQAYMIIRLKEIIDMAYTKRDKKTDIKKEGIKVEYKGSNKNIFTASIWKPKKFEKKGFTRFFTLLDINGVGIVGSLMLPEGSEGEWDALEDIAKDAFFAFPSYYNEDTKKYSNQVYIPKDNEGLKDDLNEFVKYAIADAKLLDL